MCTNKFFDRCSSLSIRYREIRVRVLAQQMISIAKPSRENIAESVLFCTPASEDMRIIFENYAGDFKSDGQNELMSELKRVRYSHLIFSLRHSYSIHLEVIQ